MTVNSAVFYKDYDASPSAIEFAFNFPIGKGTVFVFNRTDYSQLNQLSYSIVMSSYNSGKVVFAAPPNKPLRLVRVSANTQPTQLTNQDGYFPEVVEKALDYIVMQVQELLYSSVRTPPGVPGSILPGDFFDNALRVDEGPQPILLKQELVNRFLVGDSAGIVRPLAGDALLPMVNQGAIDVIATQTTQTVSQIGVLGDGSNETAKFAGKSGLFDFMGRTVTVAAIPANVQGRNGYWRILNIDGDRSGLFPTDWATLPTSITYLETNPAYAAWTEGTGSTDIESGESSVMVSVSSGGHAVNRFQVVQHRTSGKNIWATREYLWGTDSDSPKGYQAPAHGSLGRLEFAIRKKGGSPGPYDWKLFRRHMGGKYEVGNNLRTVVGSDEVRILSSDFHFWCFEGMEFIFGVTESAPEAVGGVTFDAGVYVVTLCTDQAIRFKSKLAPIVATSTAESGGGTFTIRVAETAYTEVRFVGDLSLGEALIALSGGPETPYIVGFAPDYRVASNGAAMIGFSLAPGSVIHHVVLGNLRKGTPGFGAGFSIVKQFRPVPLAPPQNSQPSGNFIDDGTLEGMWIGFYRTQAPDTGPSLWISVDGFATAPQIFPWPTSNGWSVSCTWSSVIKPDYGTGRTIIAAFSSTRDPDVPGSGFSYIDHWIAVAKVNAAVAQGWAAFKFYRVGSVINYNHTTPDSEYSTSALGVGTCTDMPGGIRIYTAESRPFPGYVRNNYTCNHVIMKVDTRQFTGEPYAPDMAPDTVLNSGRFVIRFSGTEAITAPAVFKPGKRDFDQSLGQYNPATGIWACEQSGHYRVKICCRTANDGITNTNLRLYDSDTNADFVDITSQEPSTSSSLVRSNLPTGATTLQVGEIIVYVRCFQRLHVQVITGGVLSSLADNWIEIEKLV